MWLLFLSFIKIFKKFSFNATFRTGDYIVLQCWHQIVSGAIHSHADFYEDIFLQYLVMNLYCPTTDRSTLHVKTYSYGYFLTNFYPLRNVAHELRGTLYIMFFCEITLLQEIIILVNYRAATILMYFQQPNCETIFRHHGTTNFVILLIKNWGLEVSSLRYR